jgi:hypothetical protein
MSKLTIDQKRLDTLRRQLYGKEKNTDLNAVKKSDLQSAPTLSINRDLPNISTTTKKPQNSITTQDLGYLKKDLLKVAILSLTAIAIQLLFYFTSLKNLLNIKIF